MSTGRRLGDLGGREGCVTQGYEIESTVTWLSLLSAFAASYIGHIISSEFSDFPGALSKIIDSRALSERIVFTHISPFPGEQMTIICSWNYTLCSSVLFVVSERDFLPLFLIPLVQVYSHHWDRNSSENAAVWQTLNPGTCALNLWLSDHVPTAHKCLHRSSVFACSNSWTPLREGNSGKLSLPL